MKFWTIAYKSKPGANYYPVYEGRKDGRYYLGGTSSQLYPLLFSTKKDAEAALKRVRAVEVDRTWVEYGKFLTMRCSLQIAA